MAKTDNYFTFELCLLSRVKNIADPCELERVLREDIITRSCYIAGEAFIAKNEDYVVETYLEANEPEPEQKFDDEDPVHRVLAIGAAITNTTLGSYPNKAAQFNAVDQFIYDWQERHGADIKVRLRADIVWGFLGGKGGLTARDIVVYCAILGIAGADPYKWITKDRIRAAAHGCKSVPVLLDQIPNIFSHWITPDQVRGAEGRLEKKGFIASAIKGRQKAYSTRLSQDKLVQRINSEIANKKRIEESRKPARITS